LRTKAVTQDYSFISKQRGMFSFSRLTPDKVAQLRKDFGIYIVGSGRSNVAGMTHEHMEPLCDAVAAILKN
ncbi:aminotransferase class I/II-fold pyridoxal phosphate-dependent enzyme, partial [Marinomonas arenicola]